MIKKDVNEHLYKFLHYYAGLTDSPFYAVLITGKWGIGKTHAIKKFLSDYDRDGKKHLYVSLNGIASHNDLDNAIFQSAYPVLQWKSTNLVGQLGRSALKYFRIDTELKIGDVIDRPTDKLYVFDDLERCKINISEILGYINYIVEHDGSKVIILGNEEEIYCRNGDYRREKEKIIGKTIEIAPETENAIDHFLSETEPEAKQIIVDNIEMILSIYRKSELNNLRILRQTIWDYERLIAELDARYQNNSAAMSSLLQLVFVLSFELKAGRLNSGDIMDRMNNLILARIDSKNHGESPISLTQSRYPDVNLSSMVIPDVLLRDILGKSIIDKQQLCQALDKSEYFADKRQLPAWRILWNNFKQSDEQLEKASSIMEREFAEFKFTHPSQILHVFGLRLLLVEVGIITKPRSAVVQECKNYIDKLLDDKLLEPLPLDGEIDINTSSSDNLGYYQNDTPEFKDLYVYLEEKRKVAQEESYPEHARKLLKLLQSDIIAFADAISLSSDEGVAYQRVPIMHLINYQSFVEIILYLEPKQQEVVLEALRLRYDAGKLNGFLSEERKWLEAVRQEFINVSLEASNWRRWRLQKYVEWYLDSVL